jgi:hypothetical protein
MKTLSATPRPWYHWKAETLSFLHGLLVWAVTTLTISIKLKSVKTGLCVRYTSLIERTVKKIKRLVRPKYPVPAWMMRLILLDRPPDFFVPAILVCSRIVFHRPYVEMKPTVWYYINRKKTIYNYYLWTLKSFVSLFPPPGNLAFARMETSQHNIILFSLSVRMDILPFW